jgi:hypothetical protein
MCEIYKTAEKVVIWLGCGGKDVDPFVDAIEARIPRMGYTLRMLTSEQVQAFHAGYSRFDKLSTGFTSRSFRRYI